MFSLAHEIEIYFVAIRHNTRFAPAAAGTLIIQAGQHVLVESDLHDLCSCATLAMPELEGEARESPPR
jgi:hypothetical protein